MAYERRFDWLKQFSAHFGRAKALLHKSSSLVFELALFRLNLCFKKLFFLTALAVKKRSNWNFCAEIHCPEENSSCDYYLSYFVTLCVSSMAFDSS